jgi:hypothetical protein
VRPTWIDSFIRIDYDNKNIGGKHTILSFTPALSCIHFFATIASTKKTHSAYLALCIDPFRTFIIYQAPPCLLLTRFISINRTMKIALVTLALLGLSEAKESRSRQLVSCRVVEARIRRHLYVEPIEPVSRAIA